MWRIAQRGHALSKARGQIDDSATRRTLGRLEQEGDAAAERGDATSGTIESLRAQLGSGQRLDTLLADTEARLQLLDARLTESVTRAHELAATADEETDLDSLGHDVDGLVTEMEALRLGLEETRAVRPAPAPELGFAAAAGRSRPCPVTGPRSDSRIRPRCSRRPMTTRPPGGAGPGRGTEPTDPPAGSPPNEPS